MIHDEISDNPACENERDSLSVLWTRRRFIQAGSVASLFAFGAMREACAVTRQSAPFTFGSVPMSAAADTVVVPLGYQWRVLAAWGDPINGVGAGVRPDVSDDAQSQAAQFGMHHDGGAYFPLRGSSSKGLWVVNHEYTDDGLLHSQGMRDWSAAKVAKSQAAHGVTVAHIEQGRNGVWHVVPGPLARRVTANTPCHFSGPASGHAALQTAADPQGRTVLGTVNNCAHGVTPWGTYLSCEENINGYFSKRGTPTREEARMGLNAKGFGFRWHEFDSRFDVDAHPNEVNRFGWVVEIDPQAPHKPPVKRTALGRFKHEGAITTLAKDGRVVVYMGDDQRNEYLYKFVSKHRFRKGGPDNHRLLDEGTLYVARFDAQGGGQWLPLRWGEGPLVPEKGFPDQGYVLIHARLAADALGATPMDRPEWIAIHPKTGEVYASLTNNSERGKTSALDAANPRTINELGHIVRWNETGADAAALSFAWEIFALAGEPAANGAPRDDFGSPDGLWFDPRGILWVQTDISTQTLGKGAYAYLPNNAMLAADPVSGEFRRFLIGPKGCEITGVCMTLDLRTMFVNIQHPGESPSERSDPDAPQAVSSWPDGPHFTRPRSATIVVWRNDGQPVGV